MPYHLGWRKRTAQGNVIEDQAREPSLPSLPAAPDLMAPVAGFRDWRVTQDGLCSPRTGVPWVTRVMRAECRPQSADDLVRRPHRAPGHDCGCGIHAYFEPSDEASKISYAGVSGIVSLWGDVEIHAGGLRAEYARIEALGVYGRWTERQKSAVQTIAAALDVDILDLYDLADAAASYASPVPPGLVPDGGRKGRSGRRSRGPARLIIARS
jgi:hypothetical protein